ncbi:type II toxin-antitoxin system RelE/ParE family toxin [Nostoc sp. GT001]|uniref:type II toxin-antitoxin system RelE/ParE family toxin n=1 Tax=Nostoc sp. GT001 TaxID=3056647 RepID=UPI0025AAFA44|nr:type II toxin-antitoxin system RelE/ParE family toxin [Nostoc sp. GT001]MDM9580849.1 type II toxin-antitoxin system RelE/ParE family toxin [Nostoc sp. GT001]
MSNICRFTVTASRDIEAIIDYIADNSSFNAAESLLSKINSKCERLAKFPGMGRRRDELALNDRTQKAKEALDSIPQLCDRFRQSVLAPAFRGDLTADWREQNPDIETASILLERMKNLKLRDKIRRGVPQEIAKPEAIANWEIPETWTYASAAELPRIGAFLDLKDGNHGSNHPKTVDFTPIGLPFITAAQVKEFKIDYDSAYKISGEPLKKLRVGFSKPSDVIFTHKGSAGRVAVTDRECILTPLRGDKIP